MAGITGFGGGAKPSFLGDLVPGLGTLSTLGGLLDGSTQVGAPAPVTQLSAGPQIGGPDPLQELFNTTQMSSTPQSEISPLESAVTPPASELLGDGGLSPMAAAARDNNFGAELQSPESNGFLNGIGGFFGNLDDNLQSPSKLTGLGLLGQINPALGYAGLLSSGLFGKNKLFGGGSG